MANSNATSTTPGSAATIASAASMASQTPRPSLVMKPSPVAPTPIPHAASPSASLTTREWVVPPRPKPGRKPATDTPPTKRKAQNRAAQRAFRERRAARVGELEDQLKLIEDDYEQQQETLKANVAKLESEVLQYRTELSQWMDRCRQLEKEIAAVKRKPAQHLPSTELSLSNASSEAVVSCGNCSTDTRCQCIDDAMEAIHRDENAADQPPSASHMPPLNALHRGHVKVEPTEEMEVDFTAMFAHPGPKTSAAASPASAVPDHCGFCSDGTPCICAEMAAEQDLATTAPTSTPTMSRPHHQLAQFTPPPSEGDVANAAPNVSSSNCPSGPGTCAQCRSDPNSTLFCQSLAASRKLSGKPSAGCCGGRGEGGGCCQEPSVAPARATRSRTGGRAPAAPIEPASTSITLTCADAYTALSRHPAYQRASGDIATWMPKLHASPVHSEERPAMEIDAANVMAVLRDFDRRFGADR